MVSELRRRACPCLSALLPARLPACSCGVLADACACQSLAYCSILLHPLPPASCHPDTSLRSLPTPPPLLWLAGRAAMIGFAALLAVEAVKGSALF